jgi:hypothetical protein
MISDDGYCYKSCDGECSSCINDLCNACEDGHFLRYYQCKQCMNNCEMCEDQNSCSQCSSGYHYKDGKCKESSEKSKEMAVVIAVPISCGVGLLM